MSLHPFIGHGLPRVRPPAGGLSGGVALTVGIREAEGNPVIHDKFVIFGAGPPGGCVFFCSALIDLGERAAVAAGRLAVGTASAAR
jgi:hypothetical protein